MESFDCICGKHFDSQEELTEHWETNNIETTGRPHYRLITSGSSSLEHDTPFPGIRKDGPQ
jgi:hypothetical protein